MGPRRSFWVNPGKSDLERLGDPRAAVRDDHRLDNDREVGTPLARGRESDTGEVQPPQQKRPTTRETEWHDVNVTRQISLEMVAARFLSLLRPGNERRARERSYANP